MRHSSRKRPLRSTLGYESWVATYEPASLDLLGVWFAAEVAVRPRSQNEIAELQSRSALLASPPGVDLTNRSFSLAIDVGMYFARTLERAHPQLTWKQFTDDKQFADYGQPVLVGFGKVPLNPVRIAVTFAYGIAARKQTGKRLRELFSYWSNQVQA